MIVYANQLIAAADGLDSGSGQGKLSNGVIVTAAQLRRAGVILRDGPQPVANGIKADMPGFIEPESQYGDGTLVLQVGILPSRLYEIDPAGQEITPA